MLDRKSYLDLKRQVKCLCRTDVINLSDDMCLNDYERNLLLYFIDNKSKIQTCMELSIGKDKYTNDMKVLLTKIHNYKNTH